MKPFDVIRGEGPSILDLLPRAAALAFSAT
jgi:hypothetical protein